MNKSHISLTDKRVKDTIAVYDKLAEQYSQYIFSHILQYPLMQFTNYLKKKSKILDIGCSSGRDVEYLGEEGFDVTGIDLSKKLIALAKKKVKGKFKTMDMAKMSFKDASFNAIWCHATLCHVPKRKIVSVLKEFRRVLKEDGILYVGLREGKGQGMVEFGDTPTFERFFAFYSLEELEGILKKAGFSVLKGYSEKDCHAGTWLSVFAQKK